jgi:cephalosporin-C deacetylase
MTHDLPFNPTYGYDLAALQRVGAPDGPADFASFWQDMYNRTLAVAPKPAMRELRVSDSGKTRIFEIEYDSLDGFRVGGWLTLPVNGNATRGIVLGHGYGGRDWPSDDVFVQNVAAIFPCGRGFNRSARADLPNNGARHVLYGIESRDTYMHGKCVADLWQAVSALNELVPKLAFVDYSGTSFGGGLGAMAIAWEPRFRRAFLDVPSFGNHPLRLTLQCNGSGEAVRAHYKHHPEVVDVLQYFDAATAAKHVKIPTMVAAAQFDPAVPPPGQFAVYNALHEPKQLFVRQTGHFANPAETAENETVLSAVNEWFCTGR